MTVETDIAALKARCATIETKNKAQDAQIATLTARVLALEPPAPFVPLTFDPLTFDPLALR